MVGDEYAADGGQRRTDDERQGDDAVGVDAEQHGHLEVLRCGAHGLAHLRELDEQRKRDHRDEAGDDDQEIAGADDVGDGIQKLKVGDELRKGHKVGRLSQAHIVLEEDRHADGGDEGRKPGSAAQGAISDLLDGVAIGRAPDHRGQGGDDDDARRREPHDAERARHDERGERADHVDFPVSEVDEPEYAVHHRVAQRDERVDAASGESATKEFDEIL